MTTIKLLENLLLTDVTELKQIDKIGRAEGAKVAQRLRADADTSPLVAALRKLGEEAA